MMRQRRLSVRGRAAAQPRPAASLAWAALVIGLSGCRPGAAPQDLGAADGPPATPAVDAASADGPTVRRVSGSISVGGRVRTYTLDLPPNYDAVAAVPLIVALHGGGGSAEQFESTNLLTPKAEAAGFAVVYANGVSRPVLDIQSWNAGACCDYARDQNVDDVGFVRALIAELTARHKIDPKRIYATGHSNGGMMSYRLACELSDKIAAIAPNASALMLTPCTPVRPVPVLHSHSKPDQNVPYLGGAGTGPGVQGITFPATRDMLDGWATRDGCAAPQTTAATGYTVTKWTSCAAGVTIEYYLSDDGGHAWPGGLPGSKMGDTPTQVFNMNDLLLEFFGRHRLP